MSNIKEVFGHPFFSRKLNLPYSDKLIEEIDKFVTNTPKGWACKCESTYETGTSGFDKSLNNRLMMTLAPNIDAMLKHFINSPRQIPYHLDIWFNKYYQNQWQEIHNHIRPGILLSGIMLLTDPVKDGGHTVFQNPDNTADAWARMFDLNAPGNPNLRKTALSSYYLHGAQKHELLIFPPYLPHYVAPNLTDTPRYSLSFNVRQLR